MASAVIEQEQEEEEQQEQQDQKRKHIPPSHIGRHNLIVEITPEFKEDIRKLAAHHGFGNNMSGVVRKILRDECRKAGIKPWPGRKTQFELS